jgi:hypothetical protein
MPDTIPGLLAAAAERGAGRVWLRTDAGLLGHLAEEIRRPIAREVAEHVDRAADYQPSTSDQRPSTLD